MSLTGKWFGFGRDASYDEGLRLFDRGAYEDAARLFEACLSKGPEPAVARLARFYLAESYVQLSATQDEAGRPHEALATLERAIELHPNYPDLHMRRARIADRLGDDALRDLSLAMALELHPRYVAALAFQGLAAYRAGRREEGLKRLEEASAAAGPRGQGVFEDALARDVAGQTAEAEEAFVAMMGVEHDPANEHAALALEFLRNGQLEEAAAQFELAVRYGPRYADVRCRYAQCLLEMNRLEEAEAHLRVALELNPNYVEALAQLGIALKRLGREGEAREAFRAAAALDPHHAIATHELSRRG